MISKAEFVKIIDTIKDYYEKEEKLTKYLHEFFMDGYSAVDFCSELIDVTIKLLAKNFSEKHEASIEDDISWFVYENDFGKKEFSIRYIIPSTKDKKEYKITSIEEMYDYIVAYLKERNTDKE